LDFLRRQLYQRTRAAPTHQRGRPQGKCHRSGIRPTLHHEMASKHLQQTLLTPHFAIILHSSAWYYESYDALTVMPLTFGLLCRAKVMSLGRSFMRWSRRLLQAIREDPPFFRRCMDRLAGTWHSRAAEERRDAITVTRLLHMQSKQSCKLWVPDQLLW